MEKDIITRTIAPAPKTVRGYLSSLDVNQHHILYFNAATVVLLPQDPTKPVLNILHLSDVCAVKFSPNGRLVASIQSKGTLIISEICPDKVITVYQYENFFPSAKALDWSPDGKRICAVGEGKKVFGRVALVETGTNAGEIGAVLSQLNSCSFRPERPYKLVVGGDEMALKFFEGPPYSFKTAHQSHKGFINQVKYSPKGTYILAGGADRKLTLHDGNKFELLSQKENAHNGGIFGVDWIDDQHFVTCSSDKLIKVWNTKFQEKYVIEAGSPQDIKNPKKIQLFLVGIRVYKDMIYAINLQGNILVYKNPLSVNTTSLIKTYTGGRGKIKQILSYSDSEVVLLDFGGRILVYSLIKNKVKALNSDLKNISNGFIQEVNKQKQLFVLQHDGVVAIYRSSSSALQLSLYKKLNKIQLANISSFQTQTIVATTINNLILYNSEKQQTLKSIKITEDITTLESNNSFILIGTLKGKVYIYDQNLNQIGKIDVATFKISTIKLLPDNMPKKNHNLALIGDSLGNMKLIRLIIKETMGGHTSVITSADCDDKWIYTFSMDGRLNLWNRQALSRDKEIKDLVKGGIEAALSIKDKLFISGGDLMVQIVPKIY